MKALPMDCHTEKIKVLLDTDIGGDIDDAACLAYLLRQPACDLLGITTVGGNPLERAMIADAICRAAGKEVPIYPGLDPKTPDGGYPTPEGAVKLENWGHRAIFEQDRAVDFLYETINAQPGEVVLLAVGSFSNIAALLEKYPDAAAKVKVLVVIGGMFDEKLSTSDEMPHLNWNVWSDPRAAAILFSRAKQFRLYGLEITNRLTLPRVKARAFFSSGILKAVADFVEPWLAEHDLILHDPLAAVALFDPGLCAYRRGRVLVDLQTTEVKRYAATTFIPDNTGNCELATSVDTGGFYQSFFKVFDSPFPASGDGL